MYAVYIQLVLIRIHVVSYTYVYLYVAVHGGKSRVSHQYVSRVENIYSLRNKINEKVIILNTGSYTDGICMLYAVK